VKVKNLKNNKSQTENIKKENLENIKLKKKLKKKKVQIVKKKRRKKIIKRI